MAGWLTGGGGERDGDGKEIRLLPRPVAMDNTRKEPLKLISRFRFNVLKFVVVVAVVEVCFEGELKKKLQGGWESKDF